MKELEHLKETNKKYIVLAQSENVVNDTIVLKVYDKEDKVYKTLDLPKWWFYKYFC